MIERSYCVFKAMISHYVAKNQQHRDSCVPYVLIACRFNVHRSIGYSAFFLLYGRDPVLPFDNIVRLVGVNILIITMFRNSCFDSIMYIQQLDKI